MRFVNFGSSSDAAFAFGERFGISVPKWVVGLLVGKELI